MFCPLCKSEYRNGFTQCSDCHILLVATKQEADRQLVARIWEGGNRHEFESVLAALQQAKIPLLFREHLNVGPAAKASLMNLFSLGPKQVHDTEFEIKVLGHDAVRAAEAVRLALPEPEEDD
jgi:hypothetical protein